ncbi:hypothetical protein IAT40_004502 [Kwoniella sp. CBS 6097]
MTAMEIRAEGDLVPDHILEQFTILNPSTGRTDSGTASETCKYERPNDDKLTKGDLESSLHQCKWSGPQISDGLQPWNGSHDARYATICDLDEATVLKSSTATPSPASSFYTRGSTSSETSEDQSPTYSNNGSGLWPGPTIMDANTACDQSARGTASDKPRTDTLHSKVLNSIVRIRRGFKGLGRKASSHLSSSAGD